MNHEPSTPGYPDADFCQALDSLLADFRAWASDYGKITHDGGLFGYLNHTRQSSDRPHLNAHIWVNEDYMTLHRILDAEYRLDWRTNPRNLSREEGILLANKLKIVWAETKESREDTLRKYTLTSPMRDTAVKGFLGEFREWAKDYRRMAADRFEFYPKGDGKHPRVIALVEVEAYPRVVTDRRDLKPSYRHRETQKTNLILWEYTRELDTDETETLDRALLDAWRETETARLDSYLAYREDEIL